VTPTSVYIIVRAAAHAAAGQRELGIAAVSAADIRWLRCDLKTISLLANCLLRQMAVDAGCVETILFRDGFMTEGAASNIFAVKDGVLLAPPKNHLMLPGITYDVMLELPRSMACRMRCATSPKPRRDLPTNSGCARRPRRCCPSSRSMEARPNGTQSAGAAGTPGPTFAAMYAWYQEFKARVMRGR
jgi:D-alanine transaminase